ncbi:27118_t:CDS:2, partial [Gigaspora margarita]
AAHYQSSAQIFDSKRSQNSENYMVPQLEYTTPKSKAEQVENAELPITDKKTLNKKWHKLNLAIKEAVVKHIPFMYKKREDFTHSVKLQPISTISTINELAKSNIANIENNNEHRDKINHHIEKRYSNFTDNTTLMIDSILKRHTDQ